MIVTCSPHNFDLVKSRGADHVFDYKSETCALDIRNASNNNLRHVSDCISTESSAKICADTFGPKGGKYSALLPVQSFPRADAAFISTAAYTVFGEPFRYGKKSFPAKKEDYDFGLKLGAISGVLLAEGRIKAHPHRVRPGGAGGDSGRASGVEGG